MATTRFAVGARVQRVENRAVTGATILAIQVDGDEVRYELAYDEGGSGWWPESALIPVL